MIPAAIGTQVGGSIIRPAAFCGNVALKPTQGGINRGERQATSMSTHGVHAGCIEDMWQVAIEIAERAGGDRGCPGLFGPRRAPAAQKPGRLLVLETAGWEQLDSGSKSAFEALLEAVERAGVQLLRRTSNPLVDKLERAIANAGPICNAITAWENRWYQRNLIDQNPDGVSERAKATVAKAEVMTVGDYRAALVDREMAQSCYAAISPLADAVITLSSPGPAPLWPGDVPGETPCTAPYRRSRLQLSELHVVLAGRDDARSWQCRTCRLACRSWDSSTRTRGSPPSLDGCWRTWRPSSSHRQNWLARKPTISRSLTGGDPRIGRGHARGSQGLADQEANTSSKARSPGMPFSIARIARVPSL